MKIIIKCDKCGVEYTIDKPDGVVVSIPAECQFCPKEKTVDNAFLRCCGNCGNHAMNANVLECPVLDRKSLSYPLPSSVCSRWVPGEKGEVLG